MLRGLSWLTACGLCVLPGTQAQPRVVTEQGDLIFETSNDNVVRVRTESGLYGIVDIKNPNSTIDAIALGFSMATAMQSNLAGIRDGLLSDQLSSAVSSGAAADAQLQSSITSTIAQVGAQGTVLATRASSEDVQVAMTGFGRNVSAMLSTITAQGSTITRFLDCANDGKVLGSEGCIATEPNLTRSDDSCTWNTYGSTRWVNESASLEVCVKSVSNLSVWANVKTTFRPTRDSPAPSCLSILEADPSASSGLYWITKLAAEVGTNGDRGMQVYCLMADLDTKEGGGWALGLANTIREPAQTYMMTYRASSTRNFEWMRRRDWGSFPRGEPNKQVVFRRSGENRSTQITAGTSHHLPSLVRQASQIMYTDHELQPFLAARFPDGGQTYWNNLFGRQGTNSGRVRVQYFNSAPSSLSRSWTDRGIVWIEACSAYPWGHRADRTHFSDPCGGAHICWEDLAPCCKDRPFAHDHCSGGASWCPVYGRSRSWFGNRGGRRGGNMAMLKWFRW